MTEPIAKPASEWDERGKQLRPLITNEGAKARQRGLSHLDNPWPLDSPQHELWISGWVHGFWHER